MRSADRDLQDNSLVGSLDRFAKTADLRDLVDSILTQVHPYYVYNWGIQDVMPVWEARTHNSSNLLSLCLGQEQGQLLNLKSI